MPATTIAAIRATPVTVPLEAPLLHSNGAHWGRFVRTIVEVESSDGFLGLGEMGGGGEDATRAFAGLEPYLRGHDVFALEAMRFKICNPTASLYNNRTQLHAAIEFACPTRPAWASRSIAKSCGNITRCTATWAAIRTTAIQGGRAGSRMCRTRTQTGPIRKSRCALR